MRAHFFSPVPHAAAPVSRCVVPVLLLAACLAAPGCKRKLTDANLQCTKPDMNPKEVEAILGQPTSTKTVELPLQTTVKTLSAQNYIYEQDGKTVTVFFVDGKMVQTEGSFSK